MTSNEWTSSDGSCRLILGDCLELLPSLAWDVLITDCPYGIDYRSNTPRVPREPKGPNKWTGVTIANDGDTAVRDAVLDQLAGRAAAVFGSWKKPHWGEPRATLIWDKGDDRGMGDLSLPWKPSWEECYIYGQGWSGKRTAGVLRHSLPPNVQGAGQHPNEKPVNLMAELVSKAPPGVILDPFMGSGSTGVACVRLGRQFIGIELVQQHFDTAKRRIQDAFAAHSLFSGRGWPEDA